MFTNHWYRIKWMHSRLTNICEMYLEEPYVYSLHNMDNIIVCIVYFC